MSKYPSVTLRVQVEGQDALVLGPLDDDGNGFAMFPASGDQARLVLAVLAEATVLIAGRRPGPEPVFEVHVASTPDGMPARAKGRPQLSLVPSEPAP